MDQSIETLSKNNEKNNLNNLDCPDIMFESNEKDMEIDDDYNSSRIIGKMSRNPENIEDQEALEEKIVEKNNISIQNLILTGNQFNEYNKKDRELFKSLSIKEVHKINNHQSNLKKMKRNSKGNSICELIKQGYKNMDFQERTELFNKKVQAKIEVIRNQKDSGILKICTFMPKVIGNSKNYRTVNQFYEDQLKYEELKQNKIKEFEEIKLQQEKSFLKEKPEIDKKSLKIVKKYKNQVNNEIKIPVYEKLHKKKKLSITINQEKNQIIQIKHQKSIIQNFSKRSLSNNKERSLKPSLNQSIKNSNAQQKVSLILRSPINKKLALKKFKREFDSVINEMKLESEIKNYEQLKEILMRLNLCNPISNKEKQNLLVNNIWCKLSSSSNSKILISNLYYFLAYILHFSESLLGEQNNRDMVDTYLNDKAYEENLKVKNNTERNHNKSQSQSEKSLRYCSNELNLNRLLSQKSKQKNFEYNLKLQEFQSKIPKSSSFLLKEKITGSNLSANVNITNESKFDHKYIQNKRKIMLKKSKRKLIELLDRNYTFTPKINNKIFCEPISNLSNKHKKTELVNLVRNAGFKNNKKNEIKFSRVQCPNAILNLNLNLKKNSKSHNHYRSHSVGSKTPEYLNLRLDSIQRAIETIKRNELSKAIQEKINQKNELKISSQSNVDIFNTNEKQSDSSIYKKNKQKCNKILNKEKTPHLNSVIKSKVTNNIDQSEENHNQDKLNQEAKNNDQGISLDSKLMNKEEKKIPLLFVDIEVEDNIAERISVFEGDTIEKLSKVFAEKHHLEGNKIKEITKVLEENIEKLIQKIEFNNRNEIIKEEQNSSEDDC